MYSTYFPSLLKIPSFRQHILQLSLMQAISGPTLSKGGRKARSYGDLVQPRTISSPTRIRVLTSVFSRPQRQAGRKAHLSINSGSNWWRSFMMSICGGSWKKKQTWMRYNGVNRNLAGKNGSRAGDHVLGRFPHHCGTLLIVMYRLSARCNDNAR